MSSSDEEVDDVVVAEPIRAVKDPVFLHRVEKAFEEQILEVKKKALQDLQLGEHQSHVPIMVPKVSVLETKAQTKRRRKTSSKLLLEAPFSFQPPTFCLEENINLEIALLNRFKEGESWGNYVPKFSVAERLQDWFLEKRERFNKDEKKDDTKIIQDWFYHHLPSQQKFRSLLAVLNFLLHEDFPPKGSSNKKAKLAEGASADNQGSGSASSEAEEHMVNRMKSRDMN